MSSLKLITSIKLLIAILVAITLTAVVTYFATTRLYNPVERDLMSEFKATPSVTPTPGKQDSTTDLEPVDVLLVGLKRQRLRSKRPERWAIKAAGNPCRGLVPTVRAVLP